MKINLDYTNLTKHYVNGDWVKPISSKKFEVLNPATEELVGHIILGNTEDVDRAVDLANKAFHDFSSTSKSKRLSLLKKLREITEKRFVELAYAMTVEMGAPITMAKDAQADAALGHLDGFIHALEDLKEHEMLKNGDEIVREPIGVCGLITPWNWPINQIALKVIPALATGCTCILKPSEHTPISAMIYAEIIHEAGYPSGVFNLVHGDGPEVGSGLSKHPDIQMMSFTGSTRAGREVTCDSAETVKRVTLELGGKSPVIVDENADLKNTATKVMRGKTMNAGQICLAPDYVMVPKGKSEDFVKESETAVKSMYEDLKYNQSYTSVINEKHYDRLNNLIEDAKEKGADIRVINPADEDFSQQEVHKIPPTLILNPTDDMDIMKEEIFGPLLPVKEYDDFQETIGYVNSKDRPLGLYYFGNDKKRENDVLNNTISGGVTLNDVIWHIGQEDIPFGGVGPSGTGNYHGFDGFKNFSHAKAIYKQFSADLLAPMMPPYKGKQFESTKDSVLK